MAANKSVSDVGEDEAVSELRGMDGLQIARGLVARFIPLAKTPTMWINALPKGEALTRGQFN